MPADPLSEDKSSIDVDLDIDIDIDTDTDYFESVESTKEKEITDSVSKEQGTADEYNQVDVPTSTHVSGHVVGHLTVGNHAAHISKAVIAGGAVHAVSHAATHVASHTTRAVSPVAAHTAISAISVHSTTYSVPKRARVHRQHSGAYQVGSAALGGISIGTIVGAAVGGPVGAIVGAAAMAGVSTVSALTSKPNN